MSDTMTEQSTRVARQRADSPGVRIPPPLVYIIALVVGYFLQSRFPLPFIPQPYAMIAGDVALALGIALALTSIVTMLRGKGTVNTNAASQALVTTGVYRFSRNPMYVSNTLLYIGFALLLGLTWALIFLPLPLIYTQVAVILPEERFLTRHFGDAYRAYQARVRRWL